MSRVDLLFGRYKGAFRAGEDPDPARFLAEVEGAERRELGALIQGFLAAMPARPYDPQRLAGTRAAAVADRARATLRGEPAELETWLTLLPRARTEAQILRSELVHRLAQELGVAGREAKVGEYYHRMEQGRLPARGVSRRVLEALARLVDVPVERLRAAGERLTPPAAGGPARVFARTASPQPRQAKATPAAAPAERAPERDEVDELFTGG